MNNEGTITVLQIRIMGAGNDLYDNCFVNLSRIVFINLERRAFGVAPGDQFNVHPDDWEYFLSWFQRLA